MEGTYPAAGAGRSLVHFAGRGPGLQLAGLGERHQLWCDAAAAAAASAVRAVGS